MMELRFGILNLELPVVAAIVGQGNEWKETEVVLPYYLLQGPYSPIIL